MRLFIALPLQPQSRQKISEALMPAKKSFSRLKWVKEENMHLTLQFLGDCSAREVEALFTLFSGGEMASKGCTISWNTISAFPSERSPRVFHLPLDGGASSVKEIYREISGLIGAFMKERGDAPSSVHAFIPHITIARTGKGGPSVPFEKLGSTLGNVSGESSIDRVLLFQSILEKQGPKYEEKGFLRLREDT